MERKKFLRNSIGLLSAATIVEACKKRKDTDSAPYISSLNCAGAAVTAATAGTAYSATISVPYSDGNGVSYSAGTAIASTGVTGLTATLQSGTLASGSGSLVYVITGTATATGTALFALSFGGQSCTLSLTVNAAGGSSATITALNCSSTSFSATASAGTAYSGSASVPYTGGNGASYAAGAAIASTGVTGLSAVLSAGTLASGAGNLTFVITGTPATAGTASFAISFGGQSCSFSLTVNAASGTATITGLTCASAVYSGTAISGTTFSGSASVPYTGGNGVAYVAGSAIASTGVTGLSATLSAGTLAAGAGNLNYTITGTPASAGTASFAISFGGQSCTLNLTVNAASNTCVVAPSETEGPYPYPGGESGNPLNQSNIKGDRTGVAFTLTMKLVNTNASCAALSGYRIDIWHCDRRGYYSGYANQPGVDGTLSYVGSTWLRGYQVTDSAGSVTFQTIFPGWYTSRAAHIHVEIFNPSGTAVKITQLAFPQAIGDAVAVLTSPQYNGTVNPTTNATDTVFSDSINQNQLMTLTGSIAAGYASTHVIGIAV